MKKLLLSAAAIALAGTAAPAMAQVNGIGVADPAIVVASSQALHNAYNQIGTTFAAQRTQLQQLDTQRVDLAKKMDTNKDGRIDDAEQNSAANAATKKQYEGVLNQINTVGRPVNMARAYVVDQVAQQLNAAVQQVVSGGKVQLILPPSGVLYMADAADITQQIVAALNTRLPQVSTTPPNGWQPSQQTVQLYDDVQQVLLAAAAQQQQQQAAGAQPQAQQPAAASGAKTPPVKGR
jgi:Skp family chaperone for outer membrane proteins